MPVLLFSEETVLETVYSIRILKITIVYITVICSPSEFKTSNPLAVIARPLRHLGCFPSATSCSTGSCFWLWRGDRCRGRGTGGMSWAGQPGVCCGPTDSPSPAKAGIVQQATCFVGHALPRSHKWHRSAAFQGLLAIWQGDQILNWESFGVHSSLKQFPP